MVRAGLLVSLLCLFACSETPPGSNPPGQGGEGGSSSSDGGSGGGIPADEMPPFIELHTPEDGLVDDPEIVIEGVASDETGVDELILTVGQGLPVSIQYVPGPEIQFRFPLELTLGENHIQLEAIDGAGNRSRIERTVTWLNAPGRPPVIEVFESTPAVVNPGGEFTLHWRVKGTRPITLEIRSPRAAPIDVTDREWITDFAQAPDHELFLLRAKNTVGSNDRELLLGVGMDLQLWPRDATIAPGERQRLEVRNAKVRWEADGGQIEEVPGPPGEQHFAFHAAKPGTYTLTARSDSPIQRAASITIQVVEQQGRARSYKGIGGQLGEANGWHEPSPVVDSDGSLLVSASITNVLARYVPETDTWFAEKESLSRLHLTTDGRLFGSRGKQLLVRSPTTGELQLVTTGWDPGQTIEFFRIGGDGTILARVRLPGVGQQQELWVVSPEGISSRLHLPGDLSAQTAAVGADGTLLVAARAGSDGPPTLYMRPPGGGDWTDLGTLPQLTDGIYDLLLTRSGKIFASGRRVMVWEAGIWTELTEGLPPTCSANHLCGVFDLYERRDGTVLAVGKAAVHWLGADGVFRLLAEPSPWMVSRTPVMAAMRAIAEAPDGTLYLAGDTGVFRLLPGADAWSIAGDRGLPPNTDPTDLLVEPDGSLVISGGGWGGQPGSHSLFRRQAGSSRWEGFGDDIGQIDFPDLILLMARDRAGNLYGIPLHDIIKIDAQTGKAERLPREGLAVEPWQLQDFEVAPDGSLYVATNYDQAFRLAPGAQSWKPFSGLSCPRAFLQLPDGGLWAATCLGPMRLVKDSSWTLANEGLPVSFWNFDATDIALASDGSVLLASRKGTFRLPPGAQRWQRLGLGEASIQADRITSGGGRTWVISGETIYELSDSGSWLPIDAAPRLFLYNEVFQATPQGTLVLGGAGLLEAVDRLP